MHHIRFYDYVPDYLERRGALRPAHLAHARPYLERGELVLAGAFAEPADGAALVFRAEGADVAEGFARADPYVTAGLVTGWRIRRWMTVLGRDAAHPVALADD